MLNGINDYLYFVKIKANTPSSGPVHPYTLQELGNQPSRGLTRRVSRVFKS